MSSTHPITDAIRTAYAQTIDTTLSKVDLVAQAVLGRATDQMSASIAACQSPYPGVTRHAGYEHERGGFLSAGKNFTVHQVFELAREVAVPELAEARKFSGVGELEQSLKAAFEKAGFEVVAIFSADEKIPKMVIRDPVFVDQVKDDARYQQLWARVQARTHGGSLNRVEREEYDSNTD